MKKGKILVFDDERNDLSKVYINLLLKNYEVEATVDPKEILSRTLRINPDVLIVNGNAPGFDGHEVCQNIKEAMHIPVILLLDKDSAKTIKIDSCSADEVVHKPVDLETLNVIVSRLIEDKP